MLYYVRVKWCFSDTLQTTSCETQWLLKIQLTTIADQCQLSQYINKLYIYQKAVTRFLHKMRRKGIHSDTRRSLSEKNRSLMLWLVQDESVNGWETLKGREIGQDSSQRTLSEFETVFSSNYPALKRLILTLSSAELRAVFSSAQLQSMKNMIDRLLNSIRCLELSTNNILRLIQNGYTVLLLERDVEQFAEMMRNLYDSWIKPGMELYLWGDIDIDSWLLQLIFWAWKPEEQQSETLPLWQKIAHIDTDQFEKITEVLKPQAACRFQLMRLDDGRAISVKHSEVKINMCETDTFCLYISECSKTDHIMQMKMWESDKFFSISLNIKMCMLDFNQFPLKPEVCEEWGIEHPHFWSDRLILHCNFHMTYQSADFFAEFESDFKWKWMKNSDHEVIS